MSSKQQLNIEICMGSSCFSRGNHKSLEMIQSFIEKQNLQAEIHLKGCLCQNQCNSGPIIRINGKLYKKVEPVMVVDILEECKSASKS
ncbi:MAG: (2Fe-2S) ferredoxin domain-containing protein [candidate division KSB1 bacterium]|nr:(2Fe-2S) ferredoxin domain-containing protein [candidate division KSB1 bacterium]